MKRKKKSAVRAQTANKSERLLTPDAARACRGGMTLSFGFYLGMGTLLLLLVAGVAVYPAPSPLTDQHADPTPATRLPAEVLTSANSNLYHAGASCPYKHQQSKPLAASEAKQQGLIPCPYCIGNSAARLTPGVISRQTHQ